MSKIFFPRHVLFNKIDETYGQEHTFAALDALLAYNVSLTPLQADAVADEGLPQEGLGAQMQYFVNKQAMLEFELPFIGHATRGTAPKFSPSMRACGLAENIVAATSVNYQPANGDYESAGFGFNIDGNFFQLLGARGNLNWSLVPNAFGFMKFSITGLFVSPTSVAYSTPDLTGQQKALVIDDSTFSNFLLHGRSESPRSFDFDLGNSIESDPRLDENEIVIADRNSSGATVIDKPHLSDYNWFNHITSHTTGSISYQLGTVANKIVEVSHQKTQLLADPSIGEEKKHATLSLNYNVLHDSTDSGVSITFK